MSSSDYLEALALASANGWTIETRRLAPREMEPGDVGFLATVRASGRVVFGTAMAASQRGDRYLDVKLQRKAIQRAIRSAQELTT